MRIFILTIVLIVTLVFLSPLYSLYKIGTAVKEKDKDILNAYVIWSEIQNSVKEDVHEYLKNRSKLRKKELDNPIEGVLEDIKKIGGTLFGNKALDIAIAKVITPEGIIRLVEISEKKNKNKKDEIPSSEEDTSINKNLPDKGNFFVYGGYALEKFNFISPSDFEASVLTPDGDIYFKMRFIFPTWYLYTVKSQKLTEVISKKVEDSVDLLKNLNKKLGNLINQKND